ncbi:PRC-barrel domain-containing protein [Pseudooceanicola aestuarii]|uniref:PRC-barrel domain-containing protein n=1 Tax=Pseudooceanicola aestuarii TaxID=2697319 RepID=UPI001EF7D3BA|nr:PRC-barrel domain-containing protein [Pseudooceanicola aestuarii]
MKKLLLTTALVTASIAGAPAIAQDTQTPFVGQAEQQMVRASDFIGMRVYAAEQANDAAEVDGASQDWEDIGEINDVIMDRDGNVQTVLVDIGGFLGIGERQVGITLSEIEFKSDASTGDDDNDFFLVVNASADQLENAPEFNMDERAANAGDTMETEARDTAAATGAAMDEAADDVERTAENLGNAAEDGAEAAGQAMEDTAAAAGEELEEAGDEIAAETNATDTEAELDEMAESTTEAPAEDAQIEANAEATATTDADGEGDAMADAQVEDGETQATDTDMAATTATEEPADTETMSRDGFAAAEMEQLTAEDLEGARVYDSNDEWIGEISELVLTSDGQIQDAVIDVGGFLGIGEKPVALALDDLDILRQDGGDEVVVYLAMAEDELKSMPEYEPAE